MAYQIEYYDEACGLSPHMNPVSPATMYEAVRSAGDLIVNGVADEVIVRDLDVWEIGAVGIGYYMNFREVAHICAKGREPEHVSVDERDIISIHHIRRTRD